jgi:hypothetical protein
MGRIVLIAIATFLALVMTTKVITGEENIIYYHHEIAVTCAAAILLWLIRVPALPYLDVTILGIGLFLAFGRIGCFMVGCCHGRPHTWGVCYRQEHADAGFTPYFVGVRLFPVQLIESLWVLIAVSVGVLMVLRGSLPGSAFAWYVIAYDTGRFFFEFLRGDPERPYVSGFSQPQWISLILMVAVSFAEAAGLIPFYSWHLVATACVLLATLAIALRRRLEGAERHLLLHPRHIREVAEALERASDATLPQDWTPWTVFPRVSRREVRVEHTSLGIQVSACCAETSGARFNQYSLSRQDGKLGAETVKVLSTLVMQLRRLSGPEEIVAGNYGVFHLLVPSRTGEDFGG